MFNILVSLAVGALVTIVFGFLFGGGDFRFGYGIVPGIIAQITTYVILARRSMKEVERVMKEGQKFIEKQKIDQGIEVMQTAYPAARKQIFLQSQIDGQIGLILYASKRFDDSEPYLKRSFKRSWMPRAMLGVLYYKRKKYDEMKDVFEEAVKANKKQALLWNIYAYCMWKKGDRDAAIDILIRAQDHVGEDKKTEKNLNALKNNKKMKMRGWNMLWYQFHLDRPPAQRGNMQFRRR